MIINIVYELMNKYNKRVIALMLIKFMRMVQL